MNRISTKHIDKYDRRNIDNDNKSYKSGFNPTNEKDSTAKEIADHFNDLENIAFYRNIVKKIDVHTVREIFGETKHDVTKGTQINKPIHKPAALFNWKIQQLLVNRD